MVTTLSRQGGRRYRQFHNATSGSELRDLESVGTAPPAPTPTAAGNRRYYIDIRRRRLLGVR